VTEAPDRPGRRLKVLILEDSVEMRRRLVPLVTDVPALDVVWVAESVREARDVLRTLTPDVALLDLRLPDGSGLDVLGEIRALRKDTFVAMLTAFDTREIKRACLDAGADAYLSKASGLEELPDLLRTLAEAEQVG
jgi:DNA-binding NarL/FixJ family response regulator